MKIYGEIINAEGRLVSVTMTSASAGDDIEIGASRNDGRELWFAAEDAVTIESGFNDSLDVIIGHSASIQLQTSGFVPALSGRGFRDVAVEITMDGNVVFSGWLEPNTYNQPYVDVYDDLELNCIDRLSALQYVRFRDVWSKSGYDAAIATASTSTFLSLLTEALGKVCQGDFTVFYDGSKRLEDHLAANILKDLSVSDMVFLGDDEDDVWNCTDVVEAVLKYLNLHIVEEGGAFYIFSWERVRKGSFTWLRLAGNDTAPTRGASVLTLTNDMAGDTDGEISVTEAFNKVSLTVSPKSVTELVSSPLDALESAYAHRMLYCREYRSTELDEMLRFILTNMDPQKSLAEGSISKAYWTDWYILMKRSPSWMVGRSGKDIIGTDKQDSTSQETILDGLSLSSGACLVSMGSVTWNDTDNKKDNSPKSSLSMNDYLVITNPPADDSTAVERMPLAEYTGNDGGAVFSPPDSKTTNYIVISGSVRLEHHYPQTFRCYDDNGKAIDDAPLGLVRWGLQHGKQISVVKTGKEYIYAYKKKIAGKDNNYYFAYKWYAGQDKAGDHTEDLNPQQLVKAPAVWLTGAPPFSNAFMPPSPFDDEEMEFQYSSVGDGEDHLSKVPVLECMLIIGDKVLVEDMSKDGAMSALTWKVYKDMDTCKANHPGNSDAAEDEYYAQTFSIGFDPKIGDHLINEDHDIQTNFSYELGIDAEKGMAIPIPFTEHLHGKVQFRILGLVEDYYYNKVTRRHRTWFRKEKWRTEAVRLMDSVDAVLIKDFSIKLYSDNSLSGNQGDNDGDIVYTSDTDEAFYNKKDDIEFKIHSSFTSEECAAQGISPVIAVTTVVETDNGDGCLRVKDTLTGEVSKPEASYVSDCYEEMHLSRVEMQLSLRDTDGYVVPFGLYHSPAMGKDFYVETIERNLMAGTATLKMKEVF